MLAFGDDTTLQQNDQMTLYEYSVSRVISFLSGRRSWIIAFHNWFGLPFVCQPCTLYSPILVFYFVSVLLRLALASITFII